MEVRPGYKQTEAGVIPEDWEVKRLGDLGPFLKGSGVKKDEARSGVLPCIRYGEIYTHHDDYVKSFNSWISREVADSATQLRVGDVLFAGSGETKEEIGKCVAFVDDIEAYAGGDIVILRPISAHALFLGYLLNTPAVASQKARRGQGDAVVHISASALASIDLLLPRPAEQRAIAAALGDVDALLGGLDRLIAKKRDLKQAAMQQLLTGQTRLPGFHGEWEVNTIAELERQKLVKLSRGQVISKKDIDNAPGDCPIYSSSVHNDGLFGRYGNFMFDEELITWSVDGGGNFFHRPRHKFSVTNVCGFMRVETSRIDYRFFAAELQHLHSRKSFDYQSKAHPSVIRKEYEVLLPTLPEQTAIAAVLSDMDAELAALEARRDKTRALKQGMMQELLTGRTRLV